jgi:hypothetical protein
MRRISWILAALSVTVLAGALFAQNFAAEPLYGTHNLNTGFTPDPQAVSVQAGGDTDASTLGLVDPTGGPCRGYITVAQPDVRLNFTSGTTFPLRFYVQSTADTTLLVNMPDASWRCNDDAVGLNPVVDIPVGAVQTGQYDIWVGTYNPGTSQAATMYFTELTTNGPTP